MEAQLDRILRYWAGDYTGMMVLAGSAEATPVFVKIASIEAPQFGERVFVYLLRRDSVDGPALQQKIFSFDTDSPRDRNRMRAWAFLPDEINPALAKMPAEWQSLAPEQLQGFPDGCAFRWARTKAGFAATLTDDTCRFDSQALARTVIGELRYEIGPDALVWQESLSDVDGTLLMTTGGPVRAVRVGPMIDVRWSFYEFAGTTRAELRRMLYAAAPRDADGEKRQASTDWDVSWHGEPFTSPSGCRIDDVTTSIEVRHLLPRLSHPQSVPSDLREDWDTHHVVLLRQALRHQQFAVDAAIRIGVVLPGLGERDNCDAAAAEAARVAGELIALARRRARQYDETMRQRDAERGGFQPFGASG